VTIAPQVLRRFGMRRGSPSGAGSAIPSPWLAVAAGAGVLLGRRPRPVIHLAHAIATAGTLETDEQRADLLRTLFHEEAAELVRLARLFTDDRNAAEDLVQEAFIRLYHAADRIRDLDKAIPYLRSIVLNLARDHNRRGLMSLRHGEALTPAVSPDAPPDSLEFDEQQAAIIRALRALSPQQRNCLVLRFYLDLSEAEIAETLEISPNSVKTHTRRGLEQLRTRLEQP
jgi:RNA polymerase sigma-70 factor (sigma-E family)